MGGKSRVIRIVIAVIAVIMFLFAVMPQYFFVVTASQVSPPVDYSFGPSGCETPEQAMHENYMNTVGGQEENDASNGPTRPSDREAAEKQEQKSFNPNMDQGQTGASGGGYSGGGSGGGGGHVD